MKQIAKALCAALACLLLYAGCSAAGGSAQSTAAQGDAQTALAADPLTGGQNAWPGQRAVAVVVRNDSGAVRQWGVADAAVVLEALAEGEEGTALCLVYPAAATVPTVGPVAEGRDVYWQLLLQANVLPVQKGAGVYAYNLLDYAHATAVDAMALGNSAFTFQPARAEAAEYCWTTNGGLIGGGAAALGLATEGWARALLPFAQQEAQQPAGSFAAGGAQACVQFSAHSITRLRYDGTVYRMYRDTLPQTDYASGAQPGFANVLVLFASAWLRDDGYTWGYDLAGGSGFWLQGGSWQPVLWHSGEEDESVLCLTTPDGQPLALAGGRSYVAILSGAAGQGLAILDSAGTPQQYEGLCDTAPAAVRTALDPASPLQAAEQPYAAVYDYAYYRIANPDLYEALGADRAAYLAHFIGQGMAEGRRACPDFEVNAYRTANPDLVALFGDDLAAYYMHYIQTGKAEGRPAV